MRAALAEASAACCTSELVGCLGAPRADVARGFRSLGPDWDGYRIAMSRMKATRLRARSDPARGVL